jgi:hypothetical protein
VGRETIKIGKDLFQGNASPTVPGFSNPKIKNGRHCCAHFLGLYRKSVHGKVGRKSTKGELLKGLVQEKVCTKRWAGNRQRGSSLKGSCAGESVHEKVGRKSTKGEFSSSVLCRKKCARKGGQETDKG